MASVKLRTNMIIAGAFYKFGTIIDEQKVPPQYRKRKYILREGEIDYREKEREQQMAMAEREMEELNKGEDLLVDEGEDNKVRRIGRR
jgi:hypothetical protein